MTTTFKMTNSKRVGIKQQCRYGEGFVEIYTWDQAGTEIFTRYNFGPNQNGLGSTRIVRKGKPISLRP